MERHWHELRVDIAQLTRAVEQLARHPVGNAAVIEALNSLSQEIRQMAFDIQVLTDAVTREKTVTDSVLTLLAGVSKQITDLTAQLANADGAAQAQITAQLNSVAADINTQSDALAAAVVANTPPTTSTATTKS